MRSSDLAKSVGQKQHVILQFLRKKLVKEYETSMPGSDTQAAKGAQELYGCNKGCCDLNGSGCIA